jgi:hypothetical protein
MSQKVRSNFNISHGDNDVKLLITTTNTQYRRLLDTIRVSDVLKGILQTTAFALSIPPPPPKKAFQKPVILHVFPLSCTQISFGTDAKS